MVSNNSVTAVKGRVIDGSLLIKRGGHTGPVTADTDWKAQGFEVFGLASSEEGIGFSRSADSTPVVAWGENQVDEIWSGNAMSTTVNLFSFKNFETLKTLFGAANVTKKGTSIHVSGRDISAAEKSSIVIIGVDKQGQEVIFYAEQAAIDPNFEWTWNDQDPVAIPAVFNLYKSQTTGLRFEMFLEDDEDEVDPAGRVAKFSDESEIV